MNPKNRHAPYPDTPQIEVTLSWVTVCKLIVLATAVMIAYFTVFVGPLP